MKSLLSFISICLLVGSNSCTTKTTSKIQYLTTTCDGKLREYILYVPKDLPAKAPLVFVIHGYTDHAQNMMEQTRMNELAKKNKFAVCYPQGLKDNSGKTYWEVGYAFTKDIATNDVKFITELAKLLQHRYDFDLNNTFATGMSNGADMCVLLACKTKDIFKAIAPVCGSIMKKTFDDTPLINPIPALFINSTSDSTTYWLGDMHSKQGYGAYLPTLEMIRLFLSANKCLQIKIDSLPNHNASDGSFVIREKHESCSNNNQLWFYKVVNGGHDWPGASGNMDINASEEIWKFLSLFVKN